MEAAQAVVVETGQAVVVERAQMVAVLFVQMYKEIVSTAKLEHKQKTSC